MYVSLCTPVIHPNPLPPPLPLFQAWIYPSLFDAAVAPTLRLSTSTSPCIMHLRLVLRVYVLLFFSGSTPPPHPPPPILRFFELITSKVTKLCMMILTSFFFMSPSVCHQFTRPLVSLLLFSGVDVPLTVRRGVGTNQPTLYFDKNPVGCSSTYS